MKTGKIRKIILALVLAVIGCGSLMSAPQEDAGSYFTINEIDDALFERINGKSYKADCNVPLEELRYITVAYCDFNGETRKGEMICNKAIADDLIDIFRNLYAASYPIERIQLIDDYDAEDRKSMEANNTSCFNFRKIAGSKTLSKHALGLAVDINPLYNPFVKYGKSGRKVSPESGAPYADRTAKFPHKIDTNDLCYQEFVKHGFKWGGNWKSVKDYQHFEK